jgi:hypothetical protein
VEWRQLVDRQAASGLSRRQFCTREQINHTSFERWHRRLTRWPGSWRCRRLCAARRPGSWR